MSLLFFPVKVNLILEISTDLISHSIVLRTHKLETLLHSITPQTPCLETHQINHMCFINIIW